MSGPSRQLLGQNKEHDTSQCLLLHIYTSEAKKEKKKATYRSRKGTSKFNKALFIFFSPHYMKRKNGYTSLKDRKTRKVTVATPQELDDSNQVQYYYTQLV